MPIFLADGFQHAVADERVGFHQAPFFRRERAGLEQNVLGQADFANVVQGHATLQLVEKHAIDHAIPTGRALNALCQNPRIVLQPQQVSGSFAVAGFGHLRHSHQHGVVRPADFTGACCQAALQLAIGKLQLLREESSLILSFL